MYYYAETDVVILFVDFTQILSFTAGVTSDSIVQITSQESHMIKVSINLLPTEGALDRFLSSTKYKTKKTSIKMDVFKLSSTGQEVNTLSTLYQ